MAVEHLPRLCAALARCRAPMKAIWTSVAAAGVVVIGLLVYMVIDAAISLDHSRSENQFLRRKCELLVKLADNGLRGHTSDAVIKGVGSNVIAKLEAPELRLDDVVLRVENGRITGVDVAETCR